MYTRKIIASKVITVKEFVNFVLKELQISYTWRGSKLNAKCFDKNGNCIIACDKNYYRPLEVDTLLGDSKKAKKELNWKPKINFNEGIKLTFDWYYNNKIYYNSLKKKDIHKRLGNK